jgi:hypothetical protein
MMWLVELTKALAWPVAVVIVVLSFKAELRSFLPPFLRRKMEIELPGGFKAKIDVAEQLQGDNPSAVTLALPKPALEPSPRSAVNTIEARIRREAESIETGKKEGVLFRALAQSRLQAGHEFTYNRIFGSQILGLKRLDAPGRATVDDAREFFKPYAEQFPEMYDSYGFDGWLGFLKSNSLIAQIGNSIEITDFGRDFLVYMTDSRLSENKPW